MRFGMILVNVDPEQQKSVQCGNDDGEDVFVLAVALSFPLPNYPLSK
jgi:hypothetical protein